MRFLVLLGFVAAAGGAIVYVKWLGKHVDEFYQKHLARFFARRLHARKKRYRSALRRSQWPDLKDLFRK